MTNANCYPGHLGSGKHDNKQGLISSKDQNSSHSRMNMTVTSMPQNSKIAGNDLYKVLPWGPG
jgi:hypothetical protein